MIRAFVFLGVVAFAGCASAPKRAGDPKYLLERVCGVGANHQTVTGSVWLKAKSKEASGQFPAAVKAEAPDTLRLEVTNLLGGTEAIIDVKNDRFTIKVPKHKTQNREGYGTWGGIPLNWASELFLGKVPCPTLADGSKLSVGTDGELTVENPATLKGGAELFVYRFRTWAGESWPEALHWERKGTFSAVVDFKFDDPDTKTDIPQKWEAVSAQGEVKVRWKDRDIKVAKQP